MVKTIDLHTHSNVSDGSLTPSQLVTAAKDAGLSAIALTDHDTVNGLFEASAAAREADIEFVPGIEISTEYKGRDIHIVGLDIDFSNSALKETLHTLSMNRLHRNEQMIEMMADDGLNVSVDRFFACEGKEILTRANIASYLKKSGIVSSTDEAFKHYIGDDCPYYIPKKQATPKEAVHLILNSHGIPILAHPLLYHFTPAELETCIQDFKAMGILGMEVYYSMNRGNDTGFLMRLARKYDLKYSGGSDFHGSYKPHIALGRGLGNLFIPYDVLEHLRK